MSARVVDVDEAARHLGVDPSRVRALITSGGLSADKVGGRWLVNWESVLARERAQTAPGRPLTARNAWALLLLASGDQITAQIEPNARWRLRQTMTHHHLADLAARLERRARVHYLWAIPGELSRLRDSGRMALTGSSAAGELNLGLLSPDTVDAYVPAGRLDALVRDHALEPVSTSEANVILRGVPDEAWLLDGRRVAPRAAVGLDLATYPDARSARVGAQLLAALDAESRADR